MWKNSVEPDGPWMTIWRMRFACWLPKAANPHNVPRCYVIRTLSVMLNRVMHCITTFRSMTDCICYCGPI